MSRRKQSNPKPIKRQSEDSLESIAALLRLPLDVFRVRDPQDDVREYTLYTNRTLKSGITFGPYRGKVINDSAEDDSDSLQHASFETKGENGEDVLFAVTDESGGWLKLLRPVHSSDDPCNAAVFHNGSAAWCTITSDLESDTELFVRHQWTDDVTPATQRLSSRRDRFRRDEVSPDLDEEERNNDLDTQNRNSRRSPNAYCDMFNGRLSVGPVVKCEPSSPATPPSTSGIPGEEHCRNTEDAPAYLNGSNYAPAFPCGGTTATTKTEGPLRCDQCDTFFNSRRILDVHQSYYCQGKATLSSDTDTEDATSGQVKTEPRGVHSPGASENGDTSPPPKDLQASTPSEDAFSPGSSSTKRRREAAVSLNDGVSPSSRPGRLFRCQYCSYSTDKKASLTRHVRMHGSVGRASDGPPVATPPMARYCANCDIQFASYKNYQVHKEFYCNTRHVHKSVTNASTSPVAQQQQSLTQPPPPLHPQQHLPSQSHSPPRSATHSPPQPPGGSTSLEGTSSSAKPGYNVVHLNPHPHHQPLYAAISTSPLILVPCSYVAGAGGLSPGLIPAGNIVIPNPRQASSPEESPSKASNVIPTFTVMPDAGPLPADEEEAGDHSLLTTARTDATKVTKLVAKESSSPKVTKEALSKSPGAREEPAEQPLDLSFRKKECEESRRSPPRLLGEAGSRRSCSPPACEDLSAVPPSLPLMPLLNHDLMVRDAAPLLTSAPPVLVKQGASKCTDCNIVFYKHENYLVHKSKYCAARTSGSRGGGDSPDKSSSRDGLDTSSDKEEAGKTNHHKSPVSSPRVSNHSRTPPVTSTDNSDPCETTPLAPVVQYYCMACGIKYTSLDNLRAHQFYYCPKREMQPLALVPSYPSAALQQQPPLNSNSSTHNRISSSDYKCGKCKNAYPTEELLRQHPCVVQRKCPYCDVYCPTLSAAQRHLVTHTGIKSFRCSLCGYKGHTLRGMRTHIRIHLDKNSSTPEEAYILCMDEGGAEIGCAGRKSASLRVNSERIKSVISTEPPPEVPPVSPVSPAVVVPPAGILPGDIQLAIKAVPDDPVATGDTTHWCQICGYSSSYKGNVVRHVKLVHKDLVSTQAMSNVVNSRPGCADGLLLGKQPTEQIEHQAAVAAAITDHSNSSSSLDVKPLVVNGGLPSKNTEQQVLRVDEKPPPLLLKAESPPPPSSGSGSSSKGVKRPLSAEDGSSGGVSFKSGPKYCKSCDISFNFLSNFLAHKKFYCTPRQGEVPAQESTSVQPVQ